MFLSKVVTVYQKDCNAKIMKKKSSMQICNSCKQLSNEISCCICCKGKNNVPSNMDQSWDSCSTPTNSGQLVGDQPKWAVANIQKKHVLCLGPQETDCSVQSHWDSISAPVQQLTTFTLKGILWYVLYSEISY